MTTKTIRDVEIFAVGTWNGRSFDRTDLDDMCEAFNQLKLANKLPVKLGHGAPDTEPAQGWISAMRREGDKVLATLAQVPEELVDDIREGRWRHVSIELLSDVVADGKDYPLVPCGLAILGAARPAVESLAGLNTLFQRGVPGFRFTERLAFSRAPDEAEALRAENKRLQDLLLQQAQDNDIRSGRVVAAERARFTRRYGASATLEHWHAWVRDAPTAPANYRRNSTRAAADHGDDMPSDVRPDTEVVQLARAAMKADSTLTYSQASIQVLKANPALAEAYRHQPGVKES